MTAAMLFAHFRVKHFLGMPAVLLLLPLLFFAATAALGYSVEECRVAGWLPAAPAARSIPVSGESGLAQRIFVDLDLERFVQILDPRAVHWHFLPRQFISVVGLTILVTFGSSLDIAAIQAELGGQKLDYNGELEAIGIANLVSGLAGGATGSYIFSQTIFSAKRGVQSRWNGIVVFVGEFSLFLVPLDVLQFLPTSYIGGTMCLFGIDIMKDWLVSSRHLMSRLEYLILWFTFVITMCLTSVETFGVIEGIAFGSVASSFAFAINYAQTSDVREFVSATSSVVRPWKERQVLSSLQNSILAVSLHSFAFFGASMHMTKGIESQAEEQGARFVCLDFGRLSGIDATAADQIRMLVVQLEQGGRQVLLSSLRSSTVRRLLAAHSVVIPGSISRPVFQSLDQSLKWCEAKLLERWLPSNPLSISNIERPLTELLLQYVEGFGHSTGADGRPSPSSNDVAAARALVPHFDRLELNVGDYLFRQQDPADALFIVAAGGLRLTCPANYEKSHGTSRAQVAWVDTGHSRERSPSDASEHEEAIGVGAIVGDTAFFACHSCGLDAFAASGGCTVFRISRRRLEELELSNPSAVVLLQKVILRDLTQLQVQHLGPIQACSRLK
ncbi:unnamed protein product [Polarella glacialis]|uniref:Sulfate transporter n=1 Tax=Polarella glacialis TaxID=89957 RepID=A0A813LK29_POLGL|nr:unnamed protein product [Polarella glacialis]